jgi:uncharacterized OsmC-like protein
MKISARVKNSLATHDVTVATNGTEKKMVIAPKEDAMGSSINGGELLMLALATCYCNDIYREAAKKNIPVELVEVICDSEFGGPGEAGKNIQYKVFIQSTATKEVLKELIKHTDTIAEIHNTLRQGVSVTLVENNNA